MKNKLTGYVNPFQCTNTSRLNGETFNESHSVLIIYINVERKNLEESRKNHFQLPQN